MAVLLGWAWATQAAWALRGPGDYEDELMRRAAAEVDRLIAAGEYDQAVALAQDFQRAVRPSAHVTYEQALAQRLAGHDDEAFALYTTAIHLDPTLPGAWYDRGELRLKRGQEREARLDFEQAAELQPTAWVTHFRLADMAGRARDPRTFEAELLEALRHGFDPHVIQDDPHWHAYAADPELGEVLTRLITLYSDETLLDVLRRPATQETSR